MTRGGGIKEPVWVWGIPYTPLTYEETLEAVCGLVEEARPAFFITANTHYAMLTRDNADLREVNSRAAFILADGAPVVWASRRGPAPLPERVAGADLVFSLCEIAARRGYRVFLAGAAPGVAEAAAERLRERYPGLAVATACPPRFQDQSDEEYRDLKAKIVAARPHLLFLAASQPQGERWLFRNLEDLGIPVVGVPVGSTVDIAAGRLGRAPVWMQKTGLEWFYRLVSEPRKLLTRYARNGRFIASTLLRRPDRPATSE
ncbi:Putative N-acetylmannosaminyltransferase (plasmid) [Aquisphaera giovannonii]|uniref:N-acetylmannosaminyltransferase n=1 Tax=Aquisphaera giovannonii TaxID=406548 RepID=A0A5B9WHH2_9BACT|nr:WecB/TagA/CpsF family glycosyltransferase [Aquisphaera giovannonii]QEH39230.1 Putative N-acetylmannosaminyltransferase [Aquisphaera giovannonii]